MLLSLLFLSLFIHFIRLGLYKSMRSLFPASAGVGRAASAVVVVSRPVGVGVVVGAIGVAVVVVGPAGVVGVAGGVGPAARVRLAARVGPAAVTVGLVRAAAAATAVLGGHHLEKRGGMGFSRKKNFTG
jgi:hypothetical protein